MLYHRNQLDLSVIIPTCNRPHHLRQCLSSLPDKHSLKISLEIIVVDESTQPIDISDFNVDAHIYKSKEGLCGAYAKDVGINEARGRYVCFWDDDNQYYPNAIPTLYAAANGYDIGVVQAKHTREQSLEDVIIPQNWSGKFEHKNIDTMCFCVRTDLAVTHRWSDHKDRGTDFAWISKLAKGSNIHFLSIIIGHHIPWSVQC